MAEALTFYRIPWLQHILTGIKPKIISSHFYFFFHVFRGVDEHSITVPVFSNFYVFPRNSEEAAQFDRPPPYTIICECEPPIQDLLVKKNKQHFVLLNLDFFTSFVFIFEVGFEFWGKVDRYECIIFSQSSSIMYLSFKKTEFRTVNISYPIHSCFEMTM